MEVISLTKKVAVEDSLTNYAQDLRSQGYEVSSLTNSGSSLNGYDAIVVSGQDENIMGMQDALNKSIVIDVTGKTPKEVSSQIKNRLS